MDPYSAYDPNAGTPANQGPNAAPAPLGYTPGPETTHSIGYPPPGPPLPPGPYPAANPYAGNAYPPGYPGMPPQYAPVPPPSSGIPAAGWIGIALGIVLVIGLGVTGLVITLDRPDAPDVTASDTDGGSGGDSGGTSGSDPTDTATDTAVADPVADAAVGDCFSNYGDETTPDLETAVCGTGAFETIEIVEGASDLTACDGLPTADLAVSSTGAARVLCLSYNVMEGDDAYHAQVGDCVYGSSTPGTAWNVIDCQDGAFKVIERLEDQSSIDACTDSTYYIYGVGYSTGQTYLDTTLCLQMMYASGDAGYAEVDNCMSMNSDYTYFEFVSDCGDGNVYVTGRANELVDGESWCNGWGWAYEEVPDFPELSFTICWGWL
ncbi:LppU/SCO3897 family protein [Glycomyces terrestris]|uniref:Uncharacterized protein n=1 Tax=Glycomyces terrestris TaxID=2493553 RepID=A0A426UXX5_9ACTN|nr:hypothetical protein [Glycomyces terrestris]RRR99425.1 hypothetical protein EIW28_11990 [Glycomyces terrestris]